MMNRRANKRRIEMHDSDAGKDVDKELLVIEVVRRQIEQEYI